MQKIISTLFNYSMPLIKYDTGDLGSMDDNNNLNCSCGRELPILNSLDGRSMSSLILPNGSIVGSAGLSTAFHIENLIESQIIQTSKYEILLKLLVTDNFSDDDLKGLLKNELKKRRNL